MPLVIIFPVYKRAEGAESNYKVVLNLSSSFLNPVISLKYILSFFLTTRNKNLFECQTGL